VSVDEVARDARESGVLVSTLASYCGDLPAQPGLVIGFGAIAVDEIEEGLRLLADRFRACGSHRGPRDPGGGPG
jgi:GntR family transcriptional regulator/MocR family aminotransferase